MSTEKKAQAMFLYRTLLVLGVLYSAGLLTFLVWAFDARVKEVGDTRYVQKAQYQLDLTATQKQLDKNETRIEAVVNRR